MYFSDHDLGLDKALRDGWPHIWHGLCIHHISGNILKNLQRILGVDFQAFFKEFWVVYYSISPTALETSWMSLLNTYPLAASYLSNELWPNREQWAWTFVTNCFTAGIRTSGRIESENNINRAFGDSKTSMDELVGRMTARTEQQEESNKMRKRQVSQLILYDDMIPPPRLQHLLP